MHKAWQIFLATLLCGGAAAAVAGTILVSTFQRTPPRVGGEPQRPQKDGIAQSAGGHAKAVPRARSGATVWKEEVPEVARSPQSIRAPPSEGKETNKSSGDFAGPRGEGAPSQDGSNFVGGFECALEADEASSETRGPRCPQPYICIAALPGSERGWCLHPDSLPTLHKRCDPANAGACDTGLRCSKLTSSCEPLLLPGAKCSPTDSDMCLSGSCAANLPKWPKKPQASALRTAREAELKQVTAEDAETQEGSEYVCQKGISEEQFAHFDFRPCSGPGNGCGEDWLRKAASERQNETERTRASGLPIRFPVSNTSSKSRDYRWIPTVSSKAADEEEEDDEKQQQERGGGEDNRELAGEWIRSTDALSASSHRERTPVEQQVEKEEREQARSRGAAGNAVDPVGRPAEIRSSAQTSVRGAGDNERNEAEESTKPKRSEASTFHSGYSLSNQQQEDAALPPGETSANRGSPTLHRDSRGSTRKGTSQAHQLPRTRAQTDTDDEDEPQQKAAGMDSGTLQNDVGALAVNQPQQERRDTVADGKAGADKGVYGDQTRSGGPDRGEGTRGPQGFYLHTRSESPQSPTYRKRLETTAERHTQRQSPSSSGKSEVLLKNRIPQQESQRQSRGTTLETTTTQSTSEPTIRLKRSFSVANAQNSAQEQHTQGHLFRVSAGELLRPQKQTTANWQGARQERPQQQAVPDRNSAEQAGQRYIVQQRHDAGHAGQRYRSALRERMKTAQEDWHPELADGRYPIRTQLLTPCQQAEEAREKAASLSSPFLEQQQQQPDPACALGDCKGPPQPEERPRQAGEGQQLQKEGGRSSRPGVSYPELLRYQQTAVQQARQEKPHRLAFSLLPEKPSRKQELLQHLLDARTLPADAYEGLNKLLEQPPEEDGQLWQQPAREREGLSQSSALATHQQAEKWSGEHPSSREVDHKLTHTPSQALQEHLQNQSMSAIRHQDGVGRSLPQPHAAHALRAAGAGNSKKSLELREGGDREVSVLAEQQRIDRLPIRLPINDRSPTRTHASWAEADEKASNMVTAPLRTDGHAHAGSHPVVGEGATNGSTLADNIADLYKAGIQAVRRYWELIRTHPLILRFAGTG